MLRRHAPSRAHGRGGGMLHRSTLPPSSSSHERNNDGKDCNRNGGRNRVSRANSKRLKMLGIAGGGSGSSGGSGGSGGSGHSGAIVAVDPEREHFAVKDGADKGGGGSEAGVVPAWPESPCINNNICDGDMGSGTRGQLPARIGREANGRRSTRKATLNQQQQQRQQRQQRQEKRRSPRRQSPRLLDIRMEEAQEVGSLKSSSSSASISSNISMRSRGDMAATPVRRVPARLVVSQKGTRTSRAAAGGRMSRTSSSSSSCSSSSGAGSSSSGGSSGDGSSNSGANPTGTNTSGTSTSSSSSSSSSSRSARRTSSSGTSMSSSSSTSASSTCEGSKKRGRPTTQRVEDVENMVRTEETQRGKKDEDKDEDKDDEDSSWHPPSNDDTTENRYNLARDIMSQRVTRSKSRGDCSQGNQEPYGHHGKGRDNEGEKDGGEKEEGSVSARSMEYEGSLPRDGKPRGGAQVIDPKVTGSDDRRKAPTNSKNRRSSNVKSKRKGKGTRNTSKNVGAVRSAKAKVKAAPGDGDPLKAGDATAHGAASGSPSASHQYPRQQLSARIRTVPATPLSTSSSSVITSKREALKVQPTTGNVSVSATVTTAVSTPPPPPTSALSSIPSGPNPPPESRVGSTPPLPSTASPATFCPARRRARRLKVLGSIAPPPASPTKPPPMKKARRTVAAKFPESIKSVVPAVPLTPNSPALAAKKGRAGVVAKKLSSTQEASATKPASETKQVSAAKQISSQTVAAATAIGNDETKQEGGKEKEGGKFVEEEQEEDLPKCPFPGRKNRSWTCLGCNGARHHLTSKSAMEPLRRVHGFKVTNVADDGDCFYASIEAAVNMGLKEDEKEVTVKRMREWVAEETGEDQLAFYALQAAAHTDERWLDFVRPLSERIPSSDDDDDDDNDDDEAYDSAASSLASHARCPPTRSRRRKRARAGSNASSTSSTRSTRSRTTKTRDKETARKRQARNGKENEAEARNTKATSSVVAGGSRVVENRGGGAAPGKGSAARKAAAAVAVAANRSPKKAQSQHKSAIPAPASAPGEMTAAGRDLAGVGEMRTSISNCGAPRELEASRNAIGGVGGSGGGGSCGRGVSGWEAPAKKTTKRQSTPVSAPAAGQRGKSLASTATARSLAENGVPGRQKRGGGRNGGRVGQRRSGRLEENKGAQVTTSEATEKDEEKGQEKDRGNEQEGVVQSKKKGKGRGKKPMAAKCSRKPDESGGKAEEEDGDKKDQGLPYVENVEELRRFMRLEGSEVGHGRCMWADTFAFHVVARRLKLTILFVDMEREKNSWPYRVLATNDGYGDEERFVVLKREPNHFLLLSALMPPLTVAPPIDQSPGVAVGKHSAGGGSGTGGSGSGGVDRRPGDAPTVSTTAAAAVAASKPRTVSCFRRSELPDVIRKLWEI